MSTSSEGDERSNIQEVCFDKIGFPGNGHTNFFHEVPEDPVRELHVRNVDESHRHLLVRFALAVKSHPTIQTIKLENSVITNFSPVFVAMHKEPLPILEFHRCNIRMDAAEDINYLLMSDLVQKLVFDECKFEDDHIIETIAAGLKKNKSLRAYSCTQAVEDTTRQAQEKTTNMETLEVTLERNETVDVFSLRTIERIDSLRSLRLKFQPLSLVSLPIVERIILMCLRTKLVTQFDFSRCRFQLDALAYLMKVLSKHAVVDTLNLSWISVVEKTGTFSWFSKRYGGHTMLRVNRLVLAGGSLTREFPTIARSGLVKHLDTTSYSSFCWHIVRHLEQQLSPIEFIVDPLPVVTSWSTSKRDQTTALETITFRNDGHLSLVWFASKVGNMQCLRKLTVRHCQDNLIKDEFFPALAESLVRNRSLCELSLIDYTPTNEAVSKHLARIRCLLARNCVYQVLILEHQNKVVPAGLWVHVISRFSREPDGIFVALKDKPDIVSPQYMMTPDCSNSQNKRPRHLWAT